MNSDPNEVAIVGWGTETDGEEGVDEENSRCDIFSALCTVNENSNVLVSMGKAKFIVKCDRSNIEFGEGRTTSPLLIPVHLIVATRQLGERTSVFVPESNVRCVRSSVIEALGYSGLTNRTATIGGERRTCFRVERTLQSRNS